MVVHEDALLVMQIADVHHVKVDKIILNIKKIQFKITSKNQALSKNLCEADLQTSNGVPVAVTSSSSWR